MTVEIGLFLLILGIFPLKNLQNIDFTKSLYCDMPPGIFFFFFRKPLRNISLRDGNKNFRWPCQNEKCPINLLNLEHLLTHYIEPFELSQNRTTARATYRPTDCLTNRPAERPTGRLNVRLTNWLTNRLTDGLTYKTVSLYSVSLSVSLLVDLLVGQSGNW